MADTKISDLPAVSAALGAQEFPVNDAGTSRKATLTQVQTFLAPALPTVVAVGTSATGAGAITPGLPAGHTTNDILLLFVQTDNQAITCATYTQLGPVVGIGTAAGAGATRGTIFWKRDGGAESDPTTSDSGDHQVGQMMAIRGCPATGDPFLNIGSVRKAVASVTATGSAGATPIDNCLVVQAFFHALDSASAVFSSPTNADLDSVTEQIDVATADGNGGGIGVITGTKATAGNFTTTTATMTSGIDMGLTFIMLPAGITSRAGFIDRQVFLTAGISDTWIKPTGAKVIFTTVIGGGSSGSAGRNAATASGGGGGGGGAYMEATYPASFVGATATVTCGAGGAATANSDGAASNVGSASVTSGTTANGGLAAGVSASNSGGVGGGGGGFGNILAGNGTFSYTSQPPGVGTGGTTAGPGGLALGMGNCSGGSGAGGGTTQATSAGGSALRSGAGGGGGRSNTNVGTGGAGGLLGAFAGGATAGANGTDGTADYGGGGGAGGTSAAGPGGAGGWPGGGGGGGGSQSGAQRGGAGGDGAATITTFC